MKDIFISHSSADKAISANICETLEKEGLNCWISSRVQDLAPGQDYMDKIKWAIDNSKLFVVLFSQNSITSDQIKQELVLANERQKYGMKIFPVIIDDVVQLEEIKDYAGYVISGKEAAYWGQDDSRKELLNQLFNNLNNGITDEVAEITSVFPENNTLFGRETELDTIYDTLIKGKNVYICGMGGIGKTALIQAFCNSERCKARYDTIIYMPIEKCILRTVSNDSYLNLRTYGKDGIDRMAERRKSLSSYEYALYKLALLENSVTNNTLLIVDNYEELNDPFSDRLLSLKCSIIAASRTGSLACGDFEKITLESIRSKELSREMFEFYYGKKLEENDYEHLDTLLSDFNYHAMSLVLIAKQMSYFGKRPCDYSNRTQLQMERVYNLGQIIRGGVEGNDITRMYSKLFDLFDARTLTSEEKKIMKVLCIIPSRGIHRYLFTDLVGKNAVSTIEKFEKTGWLHNDANSPVILMHPLVRDVVMHELDIFIDDPDISEFINNFVKMLSDSWDLSYDENIKFKELALSIYYQFPTPTLSRFQDYLKLSKLLWILDCIDIGLEIQNKVKMLFLDENGNRLYSSAEAEAFLQIGFTYQGKGEYENASKELEYAMRIFENRYATAMSHLAQSYMTAGKKTLDEIEPLLKDSLSIREKYWSGTVYEAISSHLYAKVLSNFETKLDYAIKLEKKAYSIFSKLQPNGTNVSSAAYILGWLYVQTAEDDDDIEFGIEKLEEAKKIRIEKRGQFHSWMEDIYLKLGMAYNRLGDYIKAKENLEDLLKVRTEKYGEGFSGKQITESYELLKNIYTVLNDEDGIKRCRKYLKYHS